MNLRTDSRQFKRINRRELLKLSPVLALGAFAIPKLQMPLLKTGLAFSDWASARLFRSGHLARTFDDSELTPFAGFLSMAMTSTIPEWISTIGPSPLAAQCRSRETTRWRKSRRCPNLGKTRGMFASRDGTSSGALAGRGWRIS